MTRTAGLIGLALSMIPLDGPGPLRVSTVVSPKPYFVGRAIELKVEVEVEPGPSPPTIEAPKAPDLDLFAMPSDPARPSTARFVAVPRHGGPLDLPTFRARSGDRSGASKPGRLVVAHVPTEGRTAAFLGGVGPFDVRAEAEPTSVRLGGTLEFRVKMKGQAAWGSVRGPDLNEWNSSALKVEALPDTFQAAETPARTFRYRVRPLKSGPVVLPPVAVAAFDPSTRRYATKATSSVTVRVDEPPRLDPAQLIYSPRTKPTRVSKMRTVGLLSGAMAIASGSALALWIVARRRGKPGGPDPAKLAIELSKGLGDGDNAAEVARAVAGALTTFLQQTSRRPPGVLTPLEARSAFEGLTGDPMLGATAEVLVDRCDRVRFGTAGGEALVMVSEGRSFFEGVARAMVQGGR